MNVPFRDLQEFELPELEDRVPKRYHGFATALLVTDRKPDLPESLRNFYRNSSAMEQDMIAEGISEKVRGDFLRFAAAHVEAVDSYLAGRLDVADVVEQEDPGLARAGLEHVVFRGHQALLTQQIEERVTTATKAGSRLRRPRRKPPETTRANPRIAQSSAWASLGLARAQS